MTRKKWGALVVGLMLLLAWLGGSGPTRYYGGLRDNVSVSLVVSGYEHG